MPDQDSRVIRSPHVQPGEAFVMRDTMFDDGKTRVLVNPGMTDATIAKIENDLEHHERMQRAVETINRITERLQAQFGYDPSATMRGTQ